MAEQNVPARNRRILTRLGATAVAVAATLGLGTGIADATTSATPCAPTAKACMDLSARQAWLTDGAGHVIAGPFAARGGKSGAATPTGTFTVQKKVKNYWSQAFDAPMPNSVFFKPGYAFHAGSPGIASNGCIHLNRAASQRFFDTLAPGDQVQIVP
ncbi:L,D-transpeptidase [Actinomycetospora termitidis]|uniref:L,D-transpeptidase n=1 Tax=Actinomycetospora termitidis TaxID=3053470 RepID=A0ABT7M8U5_9PSEU|nr:L,D-transpeptidase [Actinomycetospora sp. Odt1-22]MDL5155848.1 L,D-transpeptidase [Actinomycetospora sp. Odt1-22]